MRRIATFIAVALALMKGEGAIAADPAPFAATTLPQLHPSWEWIAGAAVLGFAVGFIFGWRMLARRIRRKFGGLKIY